MMSDLQAVPERLEKLEKQNRGLKAGILLATVAAAVALLLAVMPYRLLNAKQPETTLLRADRIVAHEFVLEGRHGGHPIAVLTNSMTDTTLDMPVLQFFGPEPLGENGRVLRMTIGATPNPDITVYHAFGPGKSGSNNLLHLGSLGNEPELMLSSGRGNLTGVSPGGFWLRFDEGRPVLSLRDTKGFESDLGGSSLVTTKTGETHERSAASLVLFGKDGKVLWSAP